MKRLLSLLLVCLLLTGCGTTGTVETTTPAPTEETAPVPIDTETEITLSDAGIRVNGGGETAAVFTSHDIIYYEDRETYDSGNPYGEGKPSQRHSAEAAAAHTVVNITQPGTYRVTGKLSAGQIRVDLGEDTHKNPDAVVNLILDNTSITCTVAPAILFRNVYECEQSGDAEDATPEVDTTSAGANLILQGENVISGSHVAKIFKDKDGEKKLWKQDGAIYSYMSMNIFGPGNLELYADNEGIDTEMHLTIHSGNISIYSGNDGINTNEDDVSVTTINGGILTIFAGLGEEGDGIDSNGYLVINGGRVTAAAKPASDSGLDSALGSFIHGGTVVALGSTMDWAESDSNQVTMNLQFASRQPAGAKVTITREDGTQIYAFEMKGLYAREFSGLILSHAAFTQGETYQVYVDGQQMGYTGTDLRGSHGGRPMDFPESQRPPMPEGMEPPKDFDPGKTENREPRPEGMTPPEGFDPSRFPGEQPGEPGEIQTGFYMNDKVNAFSGVTAAQ